MLEGGGVMSRRRVIEGCPLVSEILGCGSSKKMELIYVLAELKLEEIGAGINSENVGELVVPLLRLLRLGALGTEGAAGARLPVSKEEKDGRWNESRAGGPVRWENHIQKNRKKETTIGGIADNTRSEKNREYESGTKKSASEQYLQNNKEESLTNRGDFGERGEDIETIMYEEGGDSGFDGRENAGSRPEEDKSNNKGDESGVGRAAGGDGILQKVLGEEVLGNLRGGVF